MNMQLKIIQINMRSKEISLFLNKREGKAVMNRLMFLYKYQKKNNYLYLIMMI